MRYLKNRVLHQLRRIRADHWLPHDDEFSLQMPMGQIRRILSKNALGFDNEGTPSWWYSSLDFRRNETDDLTKAALRYIEQHVPKDAEILGTGCGTGWMLFWLAQRGYSRIDGFDYLSNVVQAAREIAELGGLNVRLWQADGFEPQLNKNYDLVLVLHWLYSAWVGNYGNKARPEDRETLLNQFLAAYAAWIANNGLLMLELIDAISDFREPPSEIYQIRHSTEQVARCAAAVGLRIEKQMFNSNYGHLPRMLYCLRKV
jgi:SAM-dependent methyltransferase